MQNVWQSKWFWFWTSISSWHAWISPGQCWKIALVDMHLNIWRYLGSDWKGGFYINRMYRDDGWWVQVRLGGQQLALGAHSIKWFRHSLHLLIIVPAQMARTADGEEEMESKTRWVMGGDLWRGSLGWRRWSKGFKGEYGSMQSLNPCPLNWLAGISVWVEAWSCVRYGENCHTPVIGPSYFGDLTMQKVNDTSVGEEKTN